jgi:hypothetical protein
LFPCGYLASEIQSNGCRLNSVPLRSLTGILEYWNGGKMGSDEFQLQWNGNIPPYFPVFHFSNIPSFQKHRIKKNFKELLACGCKSF